MSQYESQQAKSKKPFYKKWWVWVIVAVLLIAIIPGIDDDADKTSNQTASDNNISSTIDNEEKVDDTQEPIAVEPETISVDMELSSGNYTVGIDIPSGKYDFIAVSGGGNVISSDYKINAIMGEDDGSEFYEQEYSNITLRDGVTLMIDGLVLRLTCEEASGEPLTPRNQSITEVITLGNGYFVAGEDFPAGVYDLIAVSGGGNVITDDYDLNLIMGKDQDFDMYIETFMNADIQDGVTLEIDGVRIELRPSK